ncbi:MAG: metallophosphoesterase family protein [Lachnospiraceae bacterium]|nr:metallophosphoesterase family protein [Lachnospiraceae bacterium]
MPYFFLFACIAAVAILLYLTFFFFRIIVFLVGNKHRVLLFIGSLVFTAGFMYGICMLTRVGIPVLIYLGITALVTDLVYLILRKTALKEANGKVYAIFHLGLIPVVLTTLIVIYGYQNMFHVYETRITVETDKPLRAEGYRVALLADLHYGNSITGEQLQKYCDQISAANVDFMILCGDLSDESTTPEMLEECYRILGSVKTNYGIYFVYGNHDRRRYAAGSAGYTEDMLVSVIEKNNIKILLDEIVSINNEIVLVGRDDKNVQRQGGRESNANIMKRVNTEKYVLVAQHIPEDMQEYADLGADLQLGGHMHAGQIFPINVINELTKEQNRGTRKFGNLTSIVTNGISGWGFPVRTAAHSEYMIIDIVSTAR